MRSKGRSKTPTVALLAILLAHVLGLYAAEFQPDSALIRAHLDAGRYDAAEIEARELAAATSNSTDPVSAAQASNLLVEALWRNGRGDPQTRARAEKAVEAWGALKLPADDGIAVALANLGNVFLGAGDYSRAAEAFERGLAILQRAKQRSVATAGALDNLASALLLQGRYDDARRAIDRSLEIRRDVGGEDPSLATSLELSALWFQRRGEYSKARPELERALDIRTSASPDHPQVAVTLRLLGDQLWFEGAVLDSEQVYRRALTVAETALRAGHPEIALALQNLATLELEKGDIVSSLVLRERALRIAERNYGPAHPAVAGYLNDLANAYVEQHNYVTAKPLYDRALRIKQHHFGSNHESVATAVFNLAFLAGALGDVADARRQFDRAAAIWAKRLGPYHPFVATALEGLAKALVENGRPREALPVARRALSIRERAVGVEHVDVARTLLQLGAALLQQGRPLEAEPLVARAVGIWQKANPGSQGHAAALYHSGEIELAAGKYSEAREMFAQAAAIRLRVYGSLHLEVARARQGLAHAMARVGERSMAFDTALQAETAARATLRTTVRYLPERQAIRFSDLPPAGLDVALSVVDATAESSRVSQALDALIRGRGVVLDEMAQRHRSVLGQQEPEVAALMRRVAAGRQRLANIAVRAPSDHNPVQYSTLLEAARREKEAAERALAEKSASFKQELEREEVGLDAIRRSLPPGSALVSLVRYDRTVVSQSRTVPHYAAFVLSAGHPNPVVLQLGAARVIERAVDRWRHEAGAGLLNGTSPAAADATYRTAGDRLRKLTWDPLAPHLDDVQRVFIVPDGAFSLVNFGALPIAASEYLVERAPTIHYLATERDLAAAPGETPTATGLFALGGPAFDEAATPVRPSTTSRRGVPGDCGTLQSIKFERLPATLAEATEVAALWKTAAAVTPAIGGVHLSTAQQATERAFKQQAPGRRVLHLATHGFFLGGDCSPGAPGTRAVGRLTAARPGPAPAIAMQNPLLVSGLAFAGANLRANAKPDEEDGILTAEEIAGMNLQGTEWAVLSACDTGLGAVRAGEGVFGLRRAFQIAGVRTIIMSLWSVEDEATRRWMRALYRARLDARLDTAESVRAATLHVLHDRRARNLTTHPFHWGAFVSAGDWR